MKQDQSHPLFGRVPEEMWTETLRSADLLQASMVIVL